MSEEDHSQIMLAIGKLEGLLVGVTQRLDAAYDRTSKNEQKIDTLEKNQNKLDGKLSAFSWIFGALIGIGGIVITALQLFR